MDMRNFYVLFCMAAGGMAFANATSPVHNRVIDFVPAPGQFVNAIPEWEEGDDADAMAEKAYCYTAEDGSMVSLGAWGGYITVGFETTIVNADGKRDIYIEGNAFDAANGVSTLSTGGSSEPGVVMVAYDMNGNGVPDDNEWFEIAGSEYSNSIHNYEMQWQLYNYRKRINQNYFSHRNEVLKFLFHMNFASVYIFLFWNKILS